MSLHHIINFDPVFYGERRHLRDLYPHYLRKRLGIALAYPASSINTGSKLHKELHKVPHESVKAPGMGAFGTMR